MDPHVVVRYSRAVVPSSSCVCMATVDADVGTLFAALGRIAVRFQADTYSTDSLIAVLFIR